MRTGTHERSHNSTHHSRGAGDVVICKSARANATPLADVATVASANISKTHRSGEMKLVVSGPVRGGGYATHEQHSSGIPGTGILLHTQVIRNRHAKNVLKTLHKHMM